ncbi:MAG: hypothetical protein HY906_23520 [Deltaproteobacteria bacterium]|nr:hypothetical protein [Deltaproteobacteria bacterium]
MTVSAPGYEAQTRTAHCPNKDYCGAPEPVVLHFDLVPIPGYVPDAGGPEAAADGPADGGPDDA